MYDLFNKNKGLVILRQINAVPTIILGENVQLDDIYQYQTILIVASNMTQQLQLMSIDHSQYLKICWQITSYIYSYSFTEEKLEMCYSF